MFKDYNMNQLTLPLDFRTKPEARIAAEMEQKIKQSYDPGEADQTVETYLNW